MAMMDGSSHRFQAVDSQLRPRMESPRQVVKCSWLALSAPGGWGARAGDPLFRDTCAETPSRRGSREPGAQAIPHGSGLSGLPLTLDGTHRQARYHVAAQRIEDHKRRQRIQDGDGHHVVPGCLVDVEELGYRYGHSRVVCRGEQHVLVLVLVPGE